MSPTTELLLLGLLDLQSMHGYELHEFLEHRLHFLSDLTKPTAYRLLERLYQQGLVDRQTERAGRRPERLVYQLTPVGRARFEQLLREQLASADRVTYPGNVALLFSDRLAPAERARLLERRRFGVQALRDNLLTLIQAHPTSTAPRLVLEHDLALVDAELAWIDQAIHQVPSEETP